MDSELSQRHAELRSVVGLLEHATASIEAHLSSIAATTQVETSFAAEMAQLAGAAGDGAEAPAASLLALGARRAQLCEALRATLASPLEDLLTELGFAGACQLEYEAALQEKQFAELGARTAAGQLRKPKPAVTEQLVRRLEAADARCEQARFGAVCAVQAGHARSTWESINSMHVLRMPALTHYICVPR